MPFLVEFGSVDESYVELAQRLYLGNLPFREFSAVDPGGSDERQDRYLHLISLCAWKRSKFQ